MTPDTITPQRILDLAAAFDAASEAMHRLIRAIERNDIDPASASEEVRETLEHVNHIAR
jgi:hypothetical protein